MKKIPRRNGDGERHMTDRTYFYATHNSSPLPSRREQHRYASNVLSVKDFSTEHPTGYTVNKIAASLKWTLDTEKMRKTLQEREGQSKKENGDKLPIQER